MNDVKKSKSKLEIAGLVVTVVAALPFVMSAFMKFKGGPEMMEGMTHLGLPEALVQPLGVLEVTCLVLYLIPQTAVLGAILLAGYLGGAICTHLRVGDPFFVQIGLGVLIWVGIALRDQRLQAVLPLRKPQ